MDRRLFRSRSDSMVASENCRRFSPRALIPCGTATFPAAMTKGGISLKATVPNPVMQ